MQRRFRSLAAVSVFLLLATTSGCYKSKMMDLTVARSSHTMPVAAANPVSGEDCAHTIVILPLGIPSFEKALGRALETSPGNDALTNAVVEQSMMRIPFVYGVECLKVSGNAIKSDEILKP